MVEMRKIIHIDMDAFYASVEQRDNLAYRGKPIVVGGRPEQRGAVAAASYEARKYGVRSAMPSRLAQQRCPGLIFVKPRFEIYRGISHQIREVFYGYTDLVEPLSLDEAYLDVTENKQAMPSAVAIARQIKQKIYSKTQLTATAGVSINKFLAKIASSMNKPDGLTLIPPEEAAPFIENLPIDKFHGVGQVTAAKMRNLGIHTGADLKRWSQVELVRRFGKVGQFYYRAARGEDVRPVNPNRIRKSIGAERSFAADLDSLAEMEAALRAIADDVSERMNAQHRKGHTLTLKIKYASYRQITRSRTLPRAIVPGSELRTLGLGLLQTHLTVGIPVRLLGLAVSNLEPVEVTYVQLCLDI